MKTLSIGRLASDLASLRDIIVFCLSVLDDLSPGVAKKQRSKPICQVVEAGDIPINQILSAERLLRSLCTDINKHVPPYTVFGHHPTQYTDWGVWVDLGALHAGEDAGSVCQISGSWKGVKSRYVLELGKEGLTLYRRRGKREVWTMK
jgi:hypothetical protein